MAIQAIAQTPGYNPENPPSPGNNALEMYSFDVKMKPQGAGYPSHNLYSRVDNCIKFNSVGGTEIYENEASYTLSAPLTVGNTYILRARIKAVAPCEIGLWPIWTTSPNRNQWGNSNDVQYLAGYDVSTDWNTYEWYFTAEYAIDRLDFVFGKLKGAIMFDDVSLRDAYDGNELITNGSFAKASTSGWGSPTDYSGTSFEIMSYENLEAYDSEYYKYYEGDVINIYVEPHSNFKFSKWTDETGGVISNEASFKFTMPAKNTTLFANFDYDPSDPQSPQATDSLTILTISYPERIVEGESIEMIIKTNDVVTSDLEVTLDSYFTDRLEFPRTVTIPAGSDNVTVTVTAINHDYYVDETVATIIASAPTYYSAEAKMNVLDDRLRLTIEPDYSMVREGKTMRVKIRRNCFSMPALPVMLDCDKAERFAYYKTNVIEEGKSECELEMAAIVNEKSGDDDIAVLTATADGYQTANYTISILDATLPDYTVDHLSIGNTECNVGTFLKLYASVGNGGEAAISDLPIVALYRAGQSTPLAQTIVDADLQPGMAASFPLSMPKLTEIGTHTYYVKVNPNGKVKESNYDNNESERFTVRVLAPWSATTTVSAETALIGDNITIDGQLEGEDIANAEVEIYLAGNGFRTTVNATADADGKFSAQWTVPNYAVGHISIGACFPGEELTNELSSLDVYGLRCPDGNYATCEAIVGEPKSGTIRLYNSGSLALSGVRATITSAIPENLAIDINGTFSIAPGETAEIPYTITFNGPSASDNGQRLDILFSTPQGISLSMPLYVMGRYSNAVLQLSQETINTSMCKGSSLDYSVKVTNIGGRETGKLTISMPQTSWMTLLSGQEMPSLQPGKSTDIIFRLTPDESIQINNTYDGTIGVNIENGDGVAINYNVKATSESKGKLVIEATDEYTYYTEAQPRVAGATVVVYMPNTKQIVASGTTGADGIFEVTLKEGYYDVVVSADKHDSYNATILLPPGETLHREAFMQYQVVTYSWDVEETEVEDVYEVHTNVTFDTEVPAPVLNITLPDELQPVNTVFPIVVKNEGLIAFDDAVVDLPVADGFQIEYLTSPQIGRLPAKESVTIFARLIPQEVNTAKARKANDLTLTRCIMMLLRARGKYICAGEEREREITLRRSWGECGRVEAGGGGGVAISGGGGIGGIGGGWGGFGGFSSNQGTHVNGSSHDTPVSATTKDCANNPDDPDDDDPDDPTTTDNRPTAYDGPPTRLSNCDDGLSNASKIFLSFDFIDEERKVCKGITCDGAAVGEFVLKEESILPPILCNREKWIYLWSMNPKYGTLKGNETTAKYYAPEDFPGKNSESEITVTVTCTAIEIFSGVRVDFNKEIKLYRACVAFLHGLNDSAAKCWNDFAGKLTSRGWKASTVLSYDYSKTACEYFEINEDKPQKAIDKVLKRAAYDGIIAKKVALVGHSMGGILARLHVQYVNNQNVYKVITVNTPHSGSQIGDFVRGSKKLEGLILQTNPILGFDLPAIYDLAVNSEAIDDYLNNEAALDRMNGIPCHAVASKWKYSDIAYDYLYHVGMKEQMIEVAAEAALDIAFGEFPYLALLKLLFSVERNISIQSQFQELHDNSDGVVPMTSQTANLPSQYTTILPYPLGVSSGIADFGHLHIGVTHSDDAQINLELLLKASVNDRCFTKNGFHPVDLDYEPYDPVEDLIDKVTAKGSKQKVLRHVLTPDDAKIVDGKLVVNHKAAELIFANIGDKAMVVINENMHEVELDSASVKCKVYFLNWNEADKKWANDSIIINDDHRYKGSLSGTCSTIKMSFDQTISFTRQAFRGTLTINNGYDEAPMKDVQATIEVRNTSTGELVTTHEFSITRESDEGFTDTDDMLTLAGKATGKLKYLFIPTHYAAPEEDVLYDFGGSFSYIDPASGTRVTRTLTPVTMTVKPSPWLELNYFVQRDVIADDAMTKDVEEAPELSEFALLISNHGYSEANNLWIVAEQPQVYDNAKGLLIDMQFVSSQVNGEDHALSFGQAIANDFGTVPAQSTAYGQWWLKSSLLGHMTDYDVSYTHATSYGNPDLSLIDTVKVHELIRGIPLGTDNDGRKVRGFLINDFDDEDAWPDRLFTTKDEYLPVHNAQNSIKQTFNGKKMTLEITPEDSGWQYCNILIDKDDIDIKGLSDMVNTEETDVVPFMPVTLSTPDFQRHVWISTVTMHDKSDPIHERRIHFLAYAPYLSPVSVTLDFDASVATGIDSIPTNTSDAIYNLAGQRVNKPHRGIYIQNNKKIVMSR